MKTVGILGGMGPDATVLLMQKIIAGTKAHDDCDHIPIICHQNTQVPSRIKRILEKSGEDPTPVLQRMAVDLQMMNCDFLAMPCNTAHYYYQDIYKNVKIPILNMIDLAAKKLAGLGLSKIGILASPAVKKIAIFDESFINYGLESRFSQDEDGMLTLIKNIKKGTIDDFTIKSFEEQVSQLMARKCDGILIACTELSFLRTHISSDLACLDSLDCLTEEIISLATQGDTEIVREI